MGAWWETVHKMKQLIHLWWGGWSPILALIWVLIVKHTHHIEAIAHARLQPVSRESEYPKQFQSFGATKRSNMAGHRGVPHLHQGTCVHGGVWYSNENLELWVHPLWILWCPNGDCFLCYGFCKRPLVSLYFPMCRNGEFFSATLWADLRYCIEVLVDIE